MRSERKDDRPATIKGDGWARLAWELGRALSPDVTLPPHDTDYFRGFVYALPHPDARWLIEQLGTEYTYKYLKYGMCSRGTLRRRAEQMTFDVD